MPGVGDRRTVFSRLPMSHLNIVESHALSPRFQKDGIQQSSPLLD